MAYDVFVAVCLALGVLTGAWKGFTLQLAGIASLLLGYAVALPATKLIVGQLEEASPVRGLLIFVVCHLVVSSICYGLAGAYRKKLEKEKLESWDRQLGALLGLIHGLFGALVLTLAVVVIVPSTKESILERPTGQAMREVFYGVYHALPEEAQAAMKKILERGR